MNIDKAIEVLKKLHNWLDYGAGELEPTANTVIEAIDTVVKEVEKPAYTAEDMQDFAEWCADSLYEYIGGNRWKSYDLNRIATTTQLRELWEKERRAK